MSWWDTNWKFRKKLTIDNSTQSTGLTNFPIMVKLTSLRINFNDFQSSFDLRLIALDDTTQLKYEVEYFDSTAQQAVIWVKVPNISASSSTGFVYLYYHFNPGSPSDGSDKVNVWDSNYVGVWHLAEQSGNYTNSTSITGIDTDVVGTAVVRNATQLNGRAVQLDGTTTNTQISVPHTAAFLNAFSNGGAGASTDYTIECYIQPNGTGVAGDGVGVNTGTGGIPGMYPLFTKGMADGETEAQDEHFIFGQIAVAQTGVKKLGGDFENAQVARGGLNPSNNNPNTGATTLSDGIAYHISYRVQSANHSDILVNGVVDSTVSTGAGALAFGKPNSWCTTKIGIGCAFVNAGTRNGAWKGYIDEVRISNAYRSNDWVALTSKSVKDTALTFGLAETQTTKTQTGVSNIVNVGSTSKPQLGKAAVKNAITQIIRGVGNVTFLTSTARTQIGVANIVKDPWWNFAWKFRSKITINNSSSTTQIANFPMLVRLTPTKVTYTNFSPVLANGTDIRFIASDGTTVLAYEIERWRDANNISILWVKIPLLAAGTNNGYVFMYYGNDVPGSVSTPAVSQVWTPAYAGVWHLSEQSGNYQDSTVNANHANLVTVPARNNTQLLGNCPSFTGTSSAQGIQIPNAISLQLTDYTIEAYVMQSAAGASPTSGTGSGGITTIYPIFTKGMAEAETAAADINYFLGVSGVTVPNHFACDWEDNLHNVGGGAVNNVPVTGAFNIVGDTDYYVVHQCQSGPAGFTSVYVDGVLDGTRTLPQVAGTNTNLSTPNSQNTGTLGIGTAFTQAAPNAFKGGFNGYIDEVRISNTVRSDDWITISNKSIRDNLATFSPAEALPATLRTQIGVTRITQTVVKTQLAVAKIYFVTTRNQTGKGNINAFITTTRTQSAISTIRASFFKTQLGKGSIKSQTVKLQLGVANIVKGNVFYISPTGLGTNSGTINSPWSLQKAMTSTYIGGDVILLRGGTYINVRYDIGWRGTLSNPIIMQGYPGEWPVLVGNATTNPLDQPINLIPNDGTNGAFNVILRDFEVKCPSYIGQPSSGSGSTDLSVIPTDRRVDWSRATVGVPGGIPDTSTLTVFQTLNSPTVSGIRTALLACPANQIVKIGPGTFTMTGLLDWSGVRAGVVLQGSGPTTTKLSFSSGYIYMRSGFDEGSLSIDVNLAIDALKGTNQITLTSMPAWVRVGHIYIIDQLDDNIISSATTGREGSDCYRMRVGNGPRGLGQLFKVTNIVGNTITTEYPLHNDFLVSLTGQVARAAYDPTFTTLRFKCGMENIGIEQTFAGGAHMIIMENCDSCWVKNINSFNVSANDHIITFFSYRCEFRDSYFGFSHAYDAGQGYGIGLYDISTKCLIENNIFEHLHVAMQVNYGSSGNVVAYNYAFGGSSVVGEEPSINTHGHHSHHNLFEGNYCEQKAMLDCIHGSASHNTLFRNRIAGWVSGKTLNQCCIDIDNFNKKCNAVGNILGVLGHHNTYEKKAPADTCLDTSLVVWKFGYVNAWDCDDGTGFTDFTSLDVLRHGNYDVVGGLVWDPTISNHTLPVSFYMTDKPAWFGDRPWPPYEPTTYNPATPLTTTLELIPAGYRYLHGVPPPPAAPSGTQIVPSVVNVNVAGDNIKCINIVSHDGGIGFATTSSARNIEFHGCVAFNNGLVPDFDHGFSILSPNDNTQVRKVYNCISVNNAGGGIVAIGDSSNNVSYIDIQNNIVFNNGSKVGTPGSNIFIGGTGLVAQNITVSNNYLFYDLSSTGNNLTIGDGDHSCNGCAWSNCTVSNNIMVGGDIVSDSKYFTNLVFTNNLLAGGTAATVFTTIFKYTGQIDYSAYSFNNNTYYGKQAISLLWNEVSALDFTTWKSTTGLDSSSSVIITFPVVANVYTTINSNLPGQVNAAIFRWFSTPAIVSINLAGKLAPGTGVEIRNTQDYLNRSNYKYAIVDTNNILSLDVSTTSVAAPENGTATPSSVGGQFAAFTHKCIKHKH
jgi:hypothetical protein